MAGLRAPSKSPTATELGLCPTGKDCWGAKLGVAPPTGVVFRNTEMLLPSNPLPVTTSGLPSPLKSPTATLFGPCPPTGKACGGAKLAVVAPTGVVFSSTETLYVFEMAVTMSGLLSPLKSPTATEIVYNPPGKVCWGAKLAVVAPTGVVFSSTETLYP